MQAVMHGCGLTKICTSTKLSVNKTNSTMCIINSQNTTHCSFVRHQHKASCVILCVGVLFMIIGTNPEYMLAGSVY